MNALNNLNTIITLLQQNAAKIGITLAGLMIAVYAIAIMLTHTDSPTADRKKWDKLTMVLICAGIIAGTFTFIQFATNLGKML